MSPCRRPFWSRGRSKNKSTTRTTTAAAAAAASQMTVDQDTTARNDEPWRMTDNPLTTQQPSGMMPSQVSISQNANNALLEACTRGDLDRVQAVLASQTASVHVRDARGCTPLHLASARGHLYIVQYLIEQGGARLHCKNLNGHSPMHVALVCDQGPVVQYLQSVARHPERYQPDPPSSDKFSQSCDDDLTASSTTSPGDEDLHGGGNSSSAGGAAVVVTGGLLGSRHGQEDEEDDEAIEESFFTVQEFAPPAPTSTRSIYHSSRLLAATSPTNRRRHHHQQDMDEDLPVEESTRSIPVAISTPPRHSHNGSPDESSLPRTPEPVATSPVATTPTFSFSKKGNHSPAAATTDATPSPRGNPKNMVTSSLPGGSSSGTTTTTVALPSDSTTTTGPKQGGTPSRPKTKIARPDTSLEDFLAKGMETMMQSRGNSQNQQRQQQQQQQQQHGHDAVSDLPSICGFGIPMDESVTHVSAKTPTPSSCNTSTVSLFRRQLEQRPPSQVFVSTHREAKVPPAISGSTSVDSVEHEMAVALLEQEEEEEQQQQEELAIDHQDGENDLPQDDRDEQEDNLPQDEEQSPSPPALPHAEDSDGFDEMQAIVGSTWQALRDRSRQHDCMDRIRELLNDSHVAEEPEIQAILHTPDAGFFLALSGKLLEMLTSCASVGQEGDASRGGRIQGLVEEAMSVKPSASENAADAVTSLLVLIAELPDACRNAGVTRIVNTAGRLAAHAPDALRRAVLRLARYLVRGRRQQCHETKPPLVAASEQTTNNWVNLVRKKRFQMFRRLSQSLHCLSRPNEEALLAQELLQIDTWAREEGYVAADIALDILMRQKFIVFQEDMDHFVDQWAAWFTGFHDPDQLNELPEISMTAHIDNDDMDNSKNRSEILRFFKDKSVDDLSSADSTAARMSPEDAVVTAEVSSEEFAPSVSSKVRFQLPRGGSHGSYQEGLAEGQSTGDGNGMELGHSEARQEMDRLFNDDEVSLTDSVKDGMLIRMQALIEEQRATIARLQRKLQRQLSTRYLNDEKGTKLCEMKRDALLELWEQHQDDVQKEQVSFRKGRKSVKKKRFPPRLRDGSKALVSMSQDSLKRLVAEHEQDPPAI